jgi:hypothetical protein
MAALKKVKHILTIGSEKYSFRAPDIYADFGSATGVTKAPTTDNTNYTGKLNKGDFSDGKAIKIKVRAVKTTDKGVIEKTKEFTVISSFEKAKNAVANLDSKKITVDSVTWDIQTARIPQRRRFS